MDSRYVEEKNLCIDCPDDIRGLCCHNFARVKGMILAIDGCCKFLSPINKRCLIYDHRFENEDCATIEEMIRTGTVPKGCLYVINDPEYQERENTAIFDFDIVIKKKE